MDSTKAIDHLRRVDPALSRVIDRVGPCEMTRHSEGTHFEHLTRAIVYQQLSGKAAATIHGRVGALFAPGPVESAILAGIPEETLRAAGLSRQKASYLKDLAARTNSGELEMDRLDELDDDEVIRRLTLVKGVGRWTVQMFLLFRLGRPDVLSELDLGIRKAIQNLRVLPALPTPAEVLEIAAPWHPHRSVASWYLWRSLELPPEEQ